MEPEPQAEVEIAGFSSIVGHTEVVSRLQRAVETGRVHHAYYFTGPDGVGKAATAVAFAQALNCHQEPGRGCGRCAVCSRLARNIHPDLVRVEAETKQIKILQVRQLEERLAQGAHEARGLVILIDEVERLNLAAANALLKNLEEPRPGVHFVLVSAASHRVPITVRSRCQQVRFGPLSDDEVAGLLEARAGLAADEARRVARVAEGSVGRALMLVESEEYDLWHAWVVRLATGALSPGDVPGHVQRLVQEVDDPEQVLSLLQLRLRDHVLLAAAADGDGARLVQVEPGSEEADRARATPLVVVQGRLEAVQVGLRDLRSYVNKHLALERVFLQLCRP